MTKIPDTELATHASAHLRCMAAAARVAGDGLLTASRNIQRLRVEEKSLGDFVSDADLNAEQTIAEHLKGAYPDYGWLGEETGAQNGSASGLRWIVDPLDGTTNYLKGLPHWAVSIALWDKDIPVSALIYDPVKAEMFSADAGSGAYLNGQRIQVANTKKMNAMLLATGVPAGGRITYLPHCLRDLDALMPETAGIRRWGVASLDLAYVAAGRLDAYWERNLGAWDIAAGILIVLEAGGDVRQLWPDQDLLQSGAFIAGNTATLSLIEDHLDRQRAATTA